MIAVDAERADGGDWVVTVADNGIGIAPEYAERVFGFGDRLHTDDEIQRHRHRPRRLQDGRRAPRRPHLGRARAGRRQRLPLHAPAGAPLRHAARSALDHARAPSRARPPAGAARRATGAARAGESCRVGHARQAQAGEQLGRDRHRHAGLGERAHGERVADDEHEVRLEARRRGRPATTRPSRDGAIHGSSRSSVERDPLAAREPVAGAEHGEHPLLGELLAAQRRRGRAAARPRPGRPSPRRAGPSARPRRCPPSEPSSTATSSSGSLRRAARRWPAARPWRARSGTRRGAACGARSSTSAAIWTPARSSRSATASACSSSSRPASVGTAPPRPRTSSATPSSRSSAATCWDTAGWLSASASAARENEPARATARKVRQPACVEHSISLSVHSERSLELCPADGHPVGMDILPIIALMDARTAAAGRLARRAHRRPAGARRPRRTVRPSRR